LELPQRLKDSKAAISKTIKMKFFDPYKLRGKLIIFVIGITSKAQRLKDSKAAISKTIKMKFFDPYKLRGKLIIFVIGITSKAQSLQFRKQ